MLLVKHFKTFVLLCLLTNFPAPSNYLGLAFKQNATSNQVFSARYNAENVIINTSMNTKNVALEQHETEPQTFELNGWVIFWLVATSAVLAILIVVIVAYLNEQPMVKQCLLLDLYSDALKANLLCILLNPLFALICKAAGNGVHFGPFGAQITSSTLELAVEVLPRWKLAKH